MTTRLRPLFILLSLLSLPSFCPPSHAAGTRKAGDVNGDGAVDVRDAVLLLQNVSGMAPLSPEAASVADVNTDGSLDVIDAVTILRASESGEIPAPPELSASARFHVDLGTKQVEVLPLPSASSASAKTKSSGFTPKAIFAGTKVVFHSSTVLDQPGDVGRKVLQVSLTNTSGETMGVNPDGLVTGIKLLFSDIAALSAYPDLRPKTTVSTVAGTGTASCVDGPLASATFSGLTGVAVDADGTLYVADTTCNTVRKVSNGMVSTLAGSGAAGNVDGAGTAASFNQPRNLAINPADGALYVSDFGNNRIRRITKTGEVTTVAGTGAAGGADGAGNVATFNGPLGIAADMTGALYVGEYGGHKIRKVKKTGTDSRLPASWTVSTLAGNGTAGYADANGANARFSNPSGVAVDSSGVVYVADYFNNRVRRVSAAGEVSTVAGSGASTSTDGSGDAATLYRPTGIALVNGALAVADFSGNRVRQITLKPGGSPDQAKSWQVQTLAGTGGVGKADRAGIFATFFNPYGIASDGGGSLYVTDYGNHRIRKVAPANGYFPVGNPAPTSQTDPVRLSNADGVIFYGDGTANNTTRPYFSLPQSLAAGETSESREWDFIVPEGVSAFDFTVTVEASTHSLAPPTAESGVGSSDVTVRTVAGSSSLGFVNGSTSAAQFGGLQGIALDAIGNLYVVDAAYNSVRRIGADGRVSTIAGVRGKVAGYVNGLGTSAQFNNPWGIAVTSDGKTLYVTDYSNNLIRQISQIGTDPARPENWLVTTIAGIAGTGGYVDGITGDQARFNGPYGITLDANGNLYVAETLGNRVRQLQLVGSNSSLSTSWYVSLVAGDTTAPGGVVGSADGISSNARFSSPRMIATDPAGNLYVTDAGNHKIRKITPGKQVTTLAGTGAFGYADGPGGSAQFWIPIGITIDSAGYLYVGEYGNNRIRRISPTGGVTTVAGTGGSGYEDGPGDTATLDSLVGLVADPSGNVYFTNYSDVRVIQRVLK